MAFQKGVPPREDVTHHRVDRIVEVPTYKEVIVEKPRYVNKDYEVPNVVYKDQVIQRPVIVDKEITNTVVKTVEVIVEKPRYVEKVIEVPKYVEKIVEVPKYVERIVHVDKVEVIPKKVVVDVPCEVVKFNAVEKDFIIDRPKFRDKVVDVIKPHYKCQGCGIAV